MPGQVISIEDFLKIEIVVGEIKSCDPVEGSNKLYKLSVDLGESEVRQVLSGIAKSYTAAELVGRKSVFVSNLQPREMAGLLSNGMILCARDKDGKPTILTVDPSVQNGTKVG